MGTKERKLRERGQLQKLILANGRELLSKEGLEGLTMRAIAHNIEYSQSKIYEFFSSKDRLCEALCQQLCAELLLILQEISEKKDPEKVLTQLVVKTTEFHIAHPQSDTLFTLVCFSKVGRFKIPGAFTEIEQLFRTALKNLKSPYITSEEEILTALTTIRCLFIGTSTIMNRDPSKETHRQALAQIKNSLIALLRGWRKQTFTK